MRIIKPEELKELNTLDAEVNYQRLVLNAKL